MNPAYGRFSLLFSGPVIMSMQLQTSSLQNTVTNGLSQLITGLIGIMLSFLGSISQVMINAVEYLTMTVLGIFGIPFTAWAHTLAGQGLIIPILFVGILGLAGVLLLAFIGLSDSEEALIDSANKFTEGINKT